MPHANHIFTSFRAPRGSCVLVAKTGGYASTCKLAPGMVVHDNAVYNQAGAMDVCGTTLSKWVAAGHDEGTTMAKWPSDEALVAWGKQVLNVAGLW